MPQEFEFVFQIPANGTASNPTRSGLIDLAKRGAYAWNIWVGIEKNAKVDFRAHDFGADPIDFTGFRFQQDADFSEAKFGKGAHFSGAKFESGARFSGARFGDPQTGLHALFDGAEFGASASFNNAVFEDTAVFQGAQFASWATFYGVEFRQRANFEGVQFGSNCGFAGAHFFREALFRGLSWPQVAGFYSDRADGARASEEFAARYDLSPDSFARISFIGTTFERDVDFSNRRFKDKTDFGRYLAQGIAASRATSFAAAPLFHGCVLHQDTSFDGALFPEAQGEDAAARAYRTLKLAFAQQQATREEQRFFRLEMAEEHLSAKGPRRWLYAAYAFLADYGFSLRRPLLFLVTSLLLAWVVYGGLAGYSFCLPPVTACSPSREWIEFGLINALPVPGLDRYADTLRVALFPEGAAGWVQVTVTLMVILQKSASLLALFLVGLALRNLFKMK